MGVLLRFSKEQAKERFLTHIVSIRKPRLGELSPFQLECFTDLVIDSAEIVKWVAESMRPFSVVEDDGFKMLMKTGRPEYYIPLRRTVARDVKHVKRHVRR
jgi:hypothetical protein